MVGPAADDDAHAVREEAGVSASGGDVLVDRPQAPAVARGRSLARALTLAVLGGLAYGSWAAFANHEHGGDAALGAGLTQGASSLVTTFCLTVVGDWILGHVRRGQYQLAAAVVTTPVLLGAVLASIHTLTGTPDVIETILPSVAGGTLFCTTYVAARRVHRDRGRRRDQPSAAR
jgi:hypothetical protein